MKKILIRILIFIILIFGAYVSWNTYINYNFGTITKDKVYKSAVIKPSKIKKFIDDNHIKTVIDLRQQSKPDEYQIEDEKKVVEKIGGVKYINIKSTQVPRKKMLVKFFHIMDDKSNYPVLIHCYDGLGRTMMYTALYRIEYENMSNDDARNLTRPYPVESFLHDSNFARGKPKGDFLINYEKRIIREDGR